MIVSAPQTAVELRKTTVTASHSDPKNGETASPATHVVHENRGGRGFVKPMGYASRGSKTSWVPVSAQWFTIRS